MDEGDIWDRPDLSLRPQAHLQEAGAVCGDIHRKGVSREVSQGTIFPGIFPCCGPWWISSWGEP